MAQRTKLNRIAALLVSVLLSAAAPKALAQNLQVKDHYLGSFKPAPGKHALRFECVGRHPFAKGNYVGVDSVRLRERWDRKRKPLS